ncbi:helix-turn-helix domain-containing protein [Nocardia sp. CA-290969]|uniref:helix-turn-helix domain-containing protein n=1 Tax=Nocardia sp. CA-290969 TaxID=3239986 RepID=UPI003D9176AD
MASAQHQPVPAIARLMQVSEAYVRQVIHDFNERGFEALDPGRPSKVDRATRERIACIARCCPANSAIRFRHGACRNCETCWPPARSLTSAAKPGRCDRRLHPLAQTARPTQTRVRSQLPNPPPGLPTQRCLTRY